MLNSSHVRRVHLPAHAFGLFGVLFCFMNPHWSALVGFLLFNFWLSCLGMSIGFHRYFTHRSFKTNKFWHYVMLIGGSLAGQGSPIFWVALHRMHHRNSDLTSDIHSPAHKGMWNAYMGWIFSLDPSEVKLANAADLTRDTAAKYIHRNYNDLMWIYWLSMFYIVVWFPVMTPFIAGAFIAGMWSIHQEAFVNSICHDPRFGIRTVETKDSSRDVHWLHYLTWGQSLHNTHHGFPASPNFGSIRNPDIGYKVIRWIKKL